MSSNHFIDYQRKRSV